MSVDQGHRTLRGLVLCSLLFIAAAPARATDYRDLDLHGRVEASDLVVLARVVDPALALMTVERALKGEAPRQIRLVAYVGRFTAPERQTALVAGALELQLSHQAR